MRIMFISDIHGIKTNLDLIKRRYEELSCTKLVVLGDLYYICPRNIMKYICVVKRCLLWLLVTINFGNCLLIKI